ncbi:MULTISPECIES: hypothetical protein [Shewanella]|uniref:hypothetical protein n=1 Tax=Shewanella TaxID=22 RepID=UPI0006D686C1|nr:MULTISPECIES: hypothetical protein [Shewanella]KPZ70268.1 hypothetical protein AN944_02340 [Shewanella sp. P1-14-1]
MPITYKKSLTTLAGILSTFAFATAINLSTVNHSMAAQYVFPQQNQSTEQQAADEASCDTWATIQTGFEPNAAASTTQAAQVVEPTAERGSGMRGAIAGAATGAMIAELGDDDRSNAAQNGAAIGAVAARRQSRRASIQQAEQQQAAEQQAQAASTVGEDNFYQARAACLEGKGYSVN